MPPSATSRPILFTEIEQFGGAERAALALCRWLSQHGSECHIVAYDDRCGITAHAAFPLQVAELKPAGGAWSRISALRRYFAGRPAGAPQPLVSGYQPAMHATLAGLRGFHTLMHDTPSLFDAAGQRTMRRRLSNRIVSTGLRSGGATVVTSEFLRDECWREFRLRAEIARMGGLAGTFTLRQPGQTLRLLSVSRIEANKRIDWLLEALAALEGAPIAPLQAPLSQIVDWHFDVAGKGVALNELRALAERLGVAQRVQFHGFVPDANLEALYAGADVFLMPAVQGYGIPAIEALGRGIPVFLHRDSGVSDILLETPWATVMEGGKANTAEALAQSLDGVLRGRHLRAALPALPTEDAWAERVAQLCGWV